MKYSIKEAISDLGRFGRYGNAQARVQEAIDDGHQFSATEITGLVQSLAGLKPKFGWGYGRNMDILESILSKQPEQGNTCQAVLDNLDNSRFGVQAQIWDRLSDVLARPTVKKTFSRYNKAQFRVATEPAIPDEAKEYLARLESILERTENLQTAVTLEPAPVATPEPAPEPAPSVVAEPTPSMDPVVDPNLSALAGKLAEAIEIESAEAGLKAQIDALQTENMEFKKAALGKKAPRPRKDEDRESFIERLNKAFESK